MQRLKPRERERERERDEFTDVRRLWHFSVCRTCASLLDLCVVELKQIIEPGKEFCSGFTHRKEKKTKESRVQLVQRSKKCYTRFSRVTFSPTQHVFQGISNNVFRVFSRNVVKSFRAVQRA